MNKNSETQTKNKALLRVKRRAKRLIGRKIYHLVDVSSTQEVAKELAIKGAEEGTVIIAERQSAGRGRMGRKWFSPPGGIWLSIILRPQLYPRHIPIISLMAAGAVTRVIKQLYSLCVNMKWPNDILIDGKKVCGILAQTGIEKDAINYVVLGIGINANINLGSLPSELRKVSTSLKKEVGKKVSRKKIFQALLKELENTYKMLSRKDITHLVDEWEKITHTISEEEISKIISRTLYRS